MRYLFMAFHFPKPEYRADLIEHIHHVGAALSAQPGLLQLADFDDPAHGRIVAVSIWESEEAYREGSRRAFASLDVTPNYELWESRMPLEVFTLSELAETAGG